MSVHVARSKRKSRKARHRSLIWLTDAQAVLGWAAILALAALVGAIYLFQASRIASVGRLVQDLQNDLNEVKRVNAVLERDIAEAQSLERLQEEVVRLGFVRAKTEDIEFLVIRDYPQATSPTPTPEIEVPPEPADSIGEALWLAFRASVGGLIRGESP